MVIHSFLLPCLILQLRFSPLQFLDHSIEIDCFYCQIEDETKTIFEDKYFIEKQVLIIQQYISSLSTGDGFREMHGGDHSLEPGRFYGKLRKYFSIWSTFQSNNLVSHPVNSPSHSISAWQIDPTRFELNRVG